LALRYFETGQKRLDAGDWPSAAENFTKAIAVNAKSKEQRMSNKSRNAFYITQSAKGANVHPGQSRDDRGT